MSLDRLDAALRPRLQEAGYDVDYREFTGGHEVPGDIALAAVARVLDGR